MKITCPHCSQHLELDPETLIALEGMSHLDCPTCNGTVEVPAPVLVPANQAAPGQGKRRKSKRVARQTQQSMNRNLLVLGVVALLVIGGVGMFLASKNGGNIFNTFQNTTNQIINNSYFTQLIADGVTTKEDLAEIAEIRPYGDGFLGVSKGAMDWDGSLDFAHRTGSKILPIGHSARESREDQLRWLSKTFKQHLTSGAWIFEDDEPGRIDPTALQVSKGRVGDWPTFLLWQPKNRSIAKAGDIASGFLEGNEGWGLFETNGKDTSIEVRPAVHNPAGWLEASDEQQGPDYYFSAPQGFLDCVKKGPLGSTIDFDFFTTETDTTSYDSLVLESSDLTIVLPKSYPRTNQWISYSYRFDPSEGWMVGKIMTTGDRPATSEEIQHVMSTATALYIRGEWKSGPDQARLDNVRFTH